jgi:hypothetical protein
MTRLQIKIGLVLIVAGSLVAASLFRREILGGTDSTFAVKRSRATDLAADATFVIQSLESAEGLSGNERRKAIAFVTGLDSSAVRASSVNNGGQTQIVRRLPRDATSR